MNPVLSSKRDSILNIATRHGVKKTKDKIIQEAIEI